MFLLVPAYPGCPGSKAVKRSLLLFLFSPTDSVINLQQTHVEIFHHTLNMSLLYLVKRMSANWWQAEICIVINVKSQGSIVKPLSWDGLHYCKFITEFDKKRISKISEHLAKLQVKRLIVSYTPFALHFCPQRCRVRQISKITCEL